MEQPQIRLSKRQTEAWRYLEDKKTTEILFGGGAGSGKSILGCIWHIHRRLNYNETRGLVGRSSLKALKESTLVTMFNVASMMGYKSGTHFTFNAQENHINWYNGSKTILKDLFQYPSDPDFTSLGSTEFTDAFIDEGTEITQKAFDIVNSRIRWKLKEYDLVPKCLITCNPSDGWVKEKYVIDNERKPVKLKDYQQFVRALLTDNPDPEFVKLYHEQLNKLSSDYDKQRLIYGDWEAQREVARPFMHQYSSARHESAQAIFQPDKPLLIMIDFNMNPFAVNFGHLWRDDKEHFHIFDELDIMHGSIPEMVDRIKAKYSNRLSSCKVTGDASGNKGELGQRDNASNYIQLMRGLGLNPKQLEVPSKNPLHDNSRTDCNYVLHNFPDFKINPATCPNTCRDMRTVQADAFNSIIKKNRHDMSQQADHLDGIRYGINSWLKEWIIWHQKSHSNKLIHK